MRSTPWAPRCTSCAAHIRRNSSLRTELLALAEERGCTTLRGGEMAVFQAGQAFGLFTGLEPDPDRMLAHFHALIA